MTILKITKRQGFTLSLEDNVFEKPQGGVGVKLSPPPPPSRPSSTPGAVLGLKSARPFCMDFN